jgi:uncharacterized membrane protein YhaH (DUF805 family)
MNLFSLNGRSKRKEYVVRLSLTVSIFVTWVYTEDYIQDVNWFSMLYVMGFCFLVFIAFFQYIPLAVRRLHDLNSSGWYVLITFLPFGQLLILWLMFKKGTPGSNKYGEPTID